MKEQILRAARWYFLLPMRLNKPVPRQPRNYNKTDVARARALYPKEYIAVMKSIGSRDSDPFIAWLRAIPVSLASQSFNDVYDGMLADERLSDLERDALVVQTLEMQEKDLLLEGVL